MPTLKDMAGKAETLAYLRPAAAGGARTRRGDAPPPRRPAAIQHPPIFEQLTAAHETPMSDLCRAWVEEALAQHFG